MHAALERQVLAGESETGFHADVVTGLSAARKTLPSKYFYDAEGSRLFEAICDLPEYYLTRTEMTLLREVVPEIAERLPPGATLVEFGSGASVKTRLLLDAASHLAAYVPIDISHSALALAAQAIRADYPSLAVIPIPADFTRPLSLPRSVRQRPVVGFFPGSTIGNFTPGEAVELLRRARIMLGDNARFILGADLVKPLEQLIPAYDDFRGVTAAFNRNLLVRINRELGADFDPQAFHHRALWNTEESRIEMHLVSDRIQTVRLGDLTVAFAEGETIHTENSYKFTPDRLAEIAERAGWQVDELWASDELPFGIALLKSHPQPSGV